MTKVWLYFDLRTQNICYNDELLFTVAHWPSKKDEQANKMLYFRRPCNLKIENYINAASLANDHYSE